MRATTFLSRTSWAKRRGGGGGGGAGARSLAVENHLYTLGPLLLLLHFPPHVSALSRTSWRRMLCGEEHPPRRLRASSAHGHVMPPNLGFLRLRDGGRSNFARACILDVLDGRKPVAEKGGVVCVAHPVLLANFTNRRLDVGIPVCLCGCVSVCETVCIQIHTHMDMTCAAQS